MHVIFISACEKKALKKTRAVLDSYAIRTGQSTWQAPMTMEGLTEVRKALKQKGITRQTAVAAQLLGYKGKTHQAMFDAIQKDRQKLFDQASIGQWYASKGVDINKFNSLYNSFAVNTRIARSKDAAQRFQLSGVPAVVVDGKYVVEGEDGKVPQVVNYLINKARAERGGK